MALSDPLLVEGTELEIAPLQIVERKRGRLRTVSFELWIPVALLVLLILLCMVGPYVLPLQQPGVGNLSAIDLPPFSQGHLLGTDPIGRDVFSRIVYGGRVSLEVGFAAEALGLVAGSLIGMVAGYVGGSLDNLLMRIMDLLLSFPTLVLALVISTYAGGGEGNVILVIAFLIVPSTARVSRAQTLRVRHREFITAAQISGARTRWILIRHVAINVYPNMVTFAALGVGLAILVEAALSFLGIGITPTTPSWGNMISQGQGFLSSDPWLLIIPALFLCFTILFLNLIGDAMRSRISSSL